MSGVGGELTETEEFLSQMQDAREEQAAQIVERRDAVQEREQKKLDAGELLVTKATSARADILPEEDNTDEGETEGKDLIKTKSHRTVNHEKTYEGEMERFGVFIKKSDDA